MKQLIIALGFVLVASVADAHFPRACICDGKWYSHGKRLNGQVCRCTGVWAPGESRNQPPREWRCEWQ